jgi:hypothetical protein
MNNLEELEQQTAEAATKYHQPVNFAPQYQKQHREYQKYQEEQRTTTQYKNAMAALPPQTWFGNAA